MEDSEIQFADLEYSTNIEKIYHISDIHIRLQKRHDEYRKVFNNLYQNLKEEVKEALGGDSKKGLIIITGDILHSKTELSPECISITADFFQNLAKIMPLIIIAGNHDANLNNNNRLDSLTPIVEKVIRRSQCYYLRQSGFYRFANIIFGLTSVFDYNFVKASDIGSLDLEGIEHKIALFHGRVDGAITDTGTIMEGERGINKKSFEGYDFTLLGDIHKHQFLIPQKMAYAGSLIQQNHGETQHNHGFLVWDLKNKSACLKEVKNEFGYITLKIKEGKLLKDKNINIPNKCYLRLEIDDKTDRVEQRKIIDEFNQKRTILELIQTNTRTKTLGSGSPSKLKIIEDDGEDFDSHNKKKDEDQEEDIDDEEDENDEEENKHEKMLRSLSFNVSNPQFQNSEIEKYLASKKVSAELIEKVKELNLIYNQQILISDTILGSSWKLKTLEFSNLFCYGVDNHICFDKNKGIVGLVAPNHSGKSSILDVILYTLYDKTSRKGTVKEVMRLGEKLFKSKLEIEMGDKTFTIIKKGNKKTNDVMSVTIDFSYSSKDKETGKYVTTKLTGKTPAETRKIIESYFGTFDDMVMTSISLQNNNTQFADSTTAEKRKEFEKLLRIDIFEKLKELSFEDSREKKAVIKHLTGELPDNALKNLLDDHINLQEKLTKIEENLIIEKEELAEYRQKESGMMIRLSSLINQIPSQYKELANKGGLDDYRSEILEEFTEGVKKLSQKLDIEIDPGEEYNEEEDNDETLKLFKKISEVYSGVNLDEWKSKEETRKEKLSTIEDKINVLSRMIHPIKKEFEKPLRDLIALNKDLGELQEKLYQSKKKIGKLKDCDWEEKHLIENFCKEIIEKQIEQHPRKGKLEKFYDDLNENIKSLLDKKYQQGDQADLKIAEKEYKKTNELIDITTRNIQQWKDYNLMVEHKEDNEKTQADINLLKKKKTKYSNSEFNTLILGYMEYQKLVKIQKDIEDLDLAFENIKLYSDTHDELNEIMEQLLLSEKRVEDLEEERGNMKGSIGVVETEMKTIKEKKKKMENYILELDTLTTYQDCLKTVPFIIIDKIIPQLETTINQMLTSLVNFTLNFNITEKDLNVYITRPHGQLPLSNASGFEKFVGSLFLRIGLIKISNLPKANFLAIDEGWSNFDYENMNNVGMIMDYLRGEFDFVILVSHLQAMREQTDQQININIEKKTGGEFGVSSVKYN